MKPEISERVTKRPTIGLMGYFGHDNIGDEAMLECWVNAIRELGALDRVVVFSANPEKHSNTYGIAAVQNVIPTSLYWHAIGLLGRNRKNFRRSLRAFRSCKLLIVGGGSLFHDRPDTSEHLLGLLRRIEMAKELGQTVLLLGVGVGPVHRAESRAALNRVLNRVDAIAVRDTASRRLLDDLGVSGPELLTTADPTFLLEMPATPRLEQIAREEFITEHSGPNIALCLRAFDLRRQTFRDAACGLCRHLMNELGACIWLLPMQTGGGEDDRIGAQEIMAEFGSSDSIRVASASHRASDAMGLISLMDLVVGEKFHSVVFAAATCKPFLAISYAPKIQSFVHELGHDDWSIDLLDIDARSLQEGFHRVWSNRSQVSVELSKALSGLKQKAEVNVSIIKRYARPITETGRLPVT